MSISGLVAFLNSWRGELIGTSNGTTKYRDEMQLGDFFDNY